MQKYADYIKQIEIESLWSGTKHILWNLDRRVNILSGVNGVGKSTILNKVVKGLAFLVTCSRGFTCRWSRRKRSGYATM